jgi:hypothetical protein
MFKPHPELPGIIVDWFKRTLLMTPVPPMADTLASAEVLNQLNFGGIAGIAQEAAAARTAEERSAGAVVS